MGKTKSILLFGAIVAICIAVFLSSSVDAAKKKSQKGHHHHHDDSPEYQSVTCGSVIKLAHQETGFRLHSHEIPYGGGSRQQSVTGFPGAEDGNSYWIVRPAYKVSCKMGEPFKNGDIIRLQHMNTKRFLHSHLHQSPLSQQQEVSCFGEGNDASSDTGDNWKVEVMEGTKWQRGSAVRLQHMDTRQYLHSHAAHRYRQPIAGQQEVTCFPYKNNDNLWTSEEGIYFPSGNK